MNWIPFALGAALLMASGDFFLKMAAGKVSNSIGVLLYGTCTFLTGLIWTLIQRQQGVPLFARPLGIVFGLLVGVSFGLATIFLYGTFARGAPVSAASPFIRLCSLLLVSGLGLILLREPLTPRYLVGLAMAVGGVYLIVAR